MLIHYAAWQAFFGEPDTAAATLGKTSNPRLLARQEIFKLSPATLRQIDITGRTATFAIASRATSTPSTAGPATSPGRRLARSRAEPARLRGYGTCCITANGPAPVMRLTFLSGAWVHLALPVCTRTEYNRLSLPAMSHWSDVVGPGMGPMTESEAQRPPPGETYLRELEEQLLAEFGERNARIERLRRLRHMETPVDIPPAYRTSAREVRTPLAREQLKRVIGSLTANRPLVHVPPAEPTEAARASADRRARWTNAALRRMDSEAARDVFGMLIDAMVADGAGRVEAAVRTRPLGGLSAALDGRRRRAGRRPSSVEPNASRSRPAFRWPGGTWT